MINNLFNSNAEQAILNSMLLDDECSQSIHEFTEDHFYNPNHKDIFRAYKLARANNEEINLVTASKYINKENIDILMTVATAPVFTCDFSSNKKTLNEYFTRRKLVQAANNIVKDAKDMTTPVEELVINAEKQIEDASDLQTTEFTSPIDLVVKTTDIIEERYRNKGQLPGYKTGIYELDKKTLGLQKKTLSIIGARPSMGKTAISLRIIENLALKVKIPVLFFSLEMGKEQIMMRLFSMLSGVSNAKLKTGVLSDGEWQAIARVSERYANSSLVVDDTPNLHWTDIMARARSFKKKYKDIVIVVDHLSEMDYTRAESKHIGVGENARGLKTISKELDCPVLLCCQLNRATEARQDKRPVLSDLRDTGEIEQVADVVAFIHRENYYNENAPANEAELSIAKNRDGETGLIELIWSGHVMRFENKEYRGVTA